MLDEDSTDRPKIAEESTPAVIPALAHPTRADKFGQAAALMAQIRADLGDALSALQGADDDDRPASPAPLDAPLLSPPWLRAGWQQMGGNEEDVSFLDHAAEAIATALRRPGLTGAAAALHALHAPALFPLHEQQEIDMAELSEERRQKFVEARLSNREARTGWRFARLVAPWIIQEACRLPSPGPWLSPAFRRNQMGYNFWAGLSVDDWAAHLYPVLGEACEAELARLERIERIVERWQEQYGRGSARRWSTSREALLMLVDYPVVTTVFLAKQRASLRAAPGEPGRAVTRQGALLIARGLEAAGILDFERRTDRKCWWRAEALRYSR